MVTTVVLTSGTSWTVPVGVTKLDLVECWGPGGGGYAAGGGGGAYASIANLSVTAGSSISYSIGTGGVGNNPTPSSDGSGPTWFQSTSTVKADYGRGSGDGSVGNEYGIAGLASNSIGTVKFSGGKSGYGPLFQSGVVNSFSGGGGSATKNSAGSDGVGDWNYTTPGPQPGNGGNAGTGGGAGGAGNTNNTSPSSNGANGTSNVEGGGGGAAGSWNDGNSIGGNGGAPGGGAGGGANLAGDGARGQIRITYGGGTAQNITVTASEKKLFTSITMPVADPIQLINSTLKKLTTSATATQFFAVAVNSQLKKYTSSVNTSPQNTAATITSTLRRLSTAVTAPVQKKLVTSMSMSVSDNVAIASTLKRLTTVIQTQPPNAVAVDSTLKKLTTTANANVAVHIDLIAASLKKLVTDVETHMTQPVIFGASLKKLQTQIVGPVVDHVAITATTKKLRTSAVFSPFNVNTINSSLKKLQTNATMDVRGILRVSTDTVETRYTIDDFMFAWLNTLPDGPAWNKDTNSVLTLSSKPKIQALVDHNNAAINMLIDSFPGNAVYSLPEWEASLGLPDECAGIAPTTQLRQSQVLARFVDDGGQSIPYFKQFAFTLGVGVSITTFRAPVAGIDTAGTALVFGPEWNFYWQVNAVPAAAQNNVLECEFNARKRVTNTIFFTYTLGVTGTSSVQSGSNTSTSQ